MAEVKGEYIAVNELKASAKDAKKMMFEGQNIRIAWAEGKRVWDVWETILSASNFSVPSTTTTLTKALLNLQSYGTDKLGAKHDMEYTISPTSISANTSTSSRTQTVTIKQTKTDKSISVTATQAGREAQSTTYGTPSITSTSISTVSASGNVTRYLTVYWSQTKTISYDNGTTSSTTVTGSSTATVISGSANNSSGAYISGGGVYVPSAGTTYYTSQRTAYTISQFNFTANGISSGTVYRTVYVYQSANTRSLNYRNYSVSVTSNKASLAAGNESATITASASKEQYYLYSSGSTETISDVSCNVILSSSYGLFYRNGSYVASTTVSSGTSVTFIPNENTSDSNRTISIVGKNAESTSTQKTLNITQYGASYEIEISRSQITGVPYSGGEYSVTVDVMKNGQVSQTLSPIVSTNASWITYTNNYLETQTVVVHVANNPNTSSRSGSVTFKHPSKTSVQKSLSVSQVAKPGGGSSTYKASVDAWWDGYNVEWEVYVTGDNQEAIDITVKIQDDYSKYGMVYHEEDANIITNMDTYNGSYDIGYFADPVYVVVYHNNNIIGYRKVY